MTERKPDPVPGSEPQPASVEPAPTPPTAPEGQPDGLRRKLLDTAERIVERERGEVPPDLVVLIIAGHHELIYRPEVPPRVTRPEARVELTPLQVRIKAVLTRTPQIPRQLVAAVNKKFGTTQKLNSHFRDSLGALVDMGQAEHVRKGYRLP